jgi:hypothetical protein
MLRQQMGKIEQSALKISGTLRAEMSSMPLQLGYLPVVDDC